MLDKKKTSPDPQPYNSPQLDEIRKTIDALDDRIHDTLMERAALVLKIGEEKRKNNIQIVQPAREARMIRRLLNRHKGALPEMAVVRIWRELVGAVSLLQTGLTATVAAPDGENEYWDLARDYFGSCLPMNRVHNANAAISDLKENKTTFAAVPWPREEDEQPWWVYLGPHAPDPMYIIVALPYGRDPDNQVPGHRALIVTKGGFDSSGEDNSFLLIQCDSQISRGRLIDMAKKAGLTTLSLSSRRGGGEGIPSYHLMEVEDYISRDDSRVRAFLSALEDPGASVVCVGGYPVPPSYSRIVKAAS